MTEPNGDNVAKNHRSVWPVFICYRQSDGRRVAERLFRLLDGVIVPVGSSGSASEDPPQLDVYFDQAAPAVADWTAVHEPYLKRARAFILVCTPGAKLIEGDGDWVHREIDWWIQNRQEAPILIDALGQGERYVPTSVAKKWPNAQRIELIPEQWSQLQPEEADALEQRTRARILGGINQSAGNIYREELAREQERSRELSRAFAAQKKLSTRLKRTSYVLAAVAILATMMAVFAYRLQLSAESRALAAQAERELTNDRHKAITLAIRGIEKATTSESAEALANAFPLPLVAISKGSPVRDVVFSAQAGCVVTINEDGQVRLWSLAGGLIAKGEGVYAQFSPDGRFVATVAPDKKVEIWDVFKSQPVSALSSRFSGNSVKFFPNGMRLLTTGANQTVEVWDTMSGQLQTVVKTSNENDSNKSGTVRADISPDGKRILTYGAGEYVHTWDASNGQLIRKTGLPGKAKRTQVSPRNAGADVSLKENGLLVTLGMADRPEVLHAEFSSDGQFILTATSDSDTVSMLQGRGRVALSPGQLGSSDNHDNARVWDAHSGKLLTEVRVAQISIASLSPDSRQMVTGSLDGGVQLWNVPDGSLKATLRGHQAEVRDVRFTSDGKYVFSSSDDGSTRLWSTFTGQQVASIPGVGDTGGGSVKFPDGKFVITIRSDGNAAVVWSLSHAELTATLSGHTDNLYHVAYSPDGRLIATASADGTARIWEASTGRHLVTLSGPEQFAGIQFTADSRRVITGGSDNAVRVWEASTGRLLSTRLFSEEISELRLSADRRIIAASGAKGTRAWDVDKDEPLATVSGEIAEAASVAPNGCCLVTANRDGTARIWRIPGGDLLGTVAGNTGELYSAEFSPDGKLLLTAGRDNLGRIWSVSDMTLLTTLAGHQGSIFDARFSSDGKRAATSSLDKTTRLWDIPSGRVIADMIPESLNNQYEFDSVSFAGDGRRVATVRNFSATTFVWDGVSGDLITAVSGHLKAVNDIAFSPDGNHIVTASGDETARVYRFVDLPEISRLLERR